jgi:hypothetical protein
MCKIAADLIVTFSALVLLQSAVAAPRVELAGDGRAKHSVITNKDASDRLQQNYLSRMSGADFKVASGTEASGITVGTVTDFANRPGGRFVAGAPTRTEDYWLRSHANDVLIIGTSDLAVEHAVWDLLHRLGYRSFFPGKHWEIVPKLNALPIEVDSFEHPEY